MNSKNKKLKIAIAGLGFGKKVPVISIASPGEVFDKVISNAQEAKARDSYLIGIAPECNGTESLII